MASIRWWKSLYRNIKKITNKNYEKKEIKKV